MANVILGFLLLRSMSYYDLIRAFEAGVSLFYSASSGSIKRALDGLHRDGLVEFEGEPGPRGRRIYRVTEAGREAFDTWMRAEIADAHLETAALARLHFLGLLDAPSRAEVKGRIEERLLSDLAKLEAFEQHLDALEIPAEFAEIARYQRATLGYGLESTRFALEWFRALE